ncbi:MAG TPA: SDR family oxidoreductase [Pyrinomonadaceae bacterium]|nr:SDR family oxidoreductase [Pyrinomonadaceae bacterium]
MASYGTHHFAEKVALVSDVGSPVGRAVSMQLALLGSFVIGIDRESTDTARRSIDELVNLGTLAKCISADPATQEGCETAAEAVREMFGRLDLLVNCLKNEPESVFQDHTQAGFIELVQANLGSVHFLTNAVTGLMKDRPGPRIVNIAWSDNSDPTFAAVQAGVIRFSETIANWLPDNFRVNCVAVGSKWPANFANDKGGRSECRRVEPDEVARAVLFLLSSESAGMNGQVLNLGHAGIGRRSE